MDVSVSLENSKSSCCKFKHQIRVNTYMSTQTLKICKVARKATECMQRWSLQNTTNVHRETLKRCPTQSLNFFFLLHSKWVIGKEHQASIHRPLEVSMEKWTLHARLVIHFYCVHLVFMYAVFLKMPTVKNPRLWHSPWYMVIISNVSFHLKIA